jgi:hypothetical protein
MEEELMRGATGIHFGTSAISYVCVCVCVCDLLTILNNISIPVLFAHNTGVILRITNITDFKSNIKTVFEHSIKWFISNIL